MQLQMVSQQMRQTEEQVAMVEQQVERLRALKAGVAGLKKASSYSQIGQGVFVKSKIEDASELLVEVGAKVFVAKPVAEAQKTIDEQVEMSENYLTQMRASLQMLNDRAMALQGEAEGMVN